MELMTRHVMVDMMALSCSSLGISSRLPTGTELSRVGETHTPPQHLAFVKTVD